MKKLLSITLALLLVLSFTGCSQNSATYKIGILEYSSHEAKDSAIAGFIEVLEEKLGDDVSFDRQHASGDANAATLIANSFVTQGVDLILCDNTQSLQIASAASNTIPILGAAVTDYPSALGITFDSVTGTNVSGTSDLAPLDKQAEMLLELFPEAENIGMLYCSSEVNSLFQVDYITKYLTDKNVSCTKYSFVDSNDLAAVAAVACEASDVIFLPTDNTIAECAQIINDIAITAKAPVIAGEKGICENCGVATLSIDYHALGRQTGAMAYEILVNNADISALPIEHDENAVKMYNPAISELLEIYIPEDYISIE